MSEIRDRIVTVAKSVKDFRASDSYRFDMGGPPYPKAVVDKGTGEAFRALLGPAWHGSQWQLDRPFRVWKDAAGNYKTEGVSGCGLCANGILRNAGIKLPWLGQDYWSFFPPYQRLDVVSCYSKLGDLTGSRKPKGARPEPGDVFCIGTGLSTHMGTTIDDDGTFVTSIDGGQVDDAAHGWLQMVKECKREWSKLHVVWVIDAVALYCALESESVYPR